MSAKVDMHDAQKLEDQINKQMADHHDRLKDRVKNRRQKRQTKIMKQSATAKQALRKKQEKELVAFEAQMISEGNAAEAMRVETCRLEVSEKALDALKGENEGLKGENEALREEVERVHDEGAAVEKEQSELITRLSEQIEVLLKIIEYVNQNMLAKLEDDKGGRHRNSPSSTVHETVGIHKFNILIMFAV